MKLRQYIAELKNTQIEIWIGRLETAQALNESTQRLESAILMMLCEELQLRDSFQKTQIDLAAQKITRRLEIVCSRKQVELKLK